MASPLALSRCVSGENRAHARRRLSVLGSTGSVGRNALAVIEALGGTERFEIVALTGNSNLSLIVAQAMRFRPRFVALADRRCERALRERLEGTGIACAAGAEAVCKAGAMPADWVMAAIAGMAGLAPTLAAARTGATLALANKESIVAGGRYFLETVRKGGGALLPVDSEHSAIFQVLETGAKDSVERLILTASGGPFRRWPAARMKRARLADALDHPSWRMGARITVDCASMFNKALEIIEASCLFDFPGKRIEILVHPQSVIHSMVAYADGAVLAQLGAPDMRTPIAYALGWPERVRAPVERLDFARLARLDFEAPDETRFPALRLAREALDAGSLACCALNSAKETARDAFMENRIGFMAMAEIVEAVLDELSPSGSVDSLGAAIHMDRKAREAAARHVRKGR